MLWSASRSFPVFENPSFGGFRPPLVQHAADVVRPVPLVLTEWNCNSHDNPPTKRGDYGKTCQIKTKTKPRPLDPDGSAIPSYGSGQSNGRTRGAKVNPQQRPVFHNQRSPTDRWPGECSRNNFLYIFSNVGQKSRGPRQTLNLKDLRGTAIALVSLRY